MAEITRRQFLRLLGVATAGALLAACAPTEPAKPAAEAGKPAAGPSGKAPEKKALIFMDGQTFWSIDPPLMTGVGEAPQFWLMYNTLTRYNEKLDLLPDLAEKWEVSDDHKTWTFHLRPNVKFSNGEPFTAADVKASLERLLDPKTNASRRTSYLHLKKIDASDPATLKIATDPADPDLHWLMADRSTGVVHAGTAKQYPEDFSQHAVGTGPLRLKSFVAQESLVLEPNPYYSGPPLGISGFTYKIMPEATTRMAALQTGEADIVLNLVPEAVDLLKSASDVDVRILPALTTVSMELKQTKPPFNDRRVRQAMNYAVNKDNLIKEILKGMASPLNSPNLPGLPDTFEFTPYAYNPDKAKQLLAEAGYPNGFEMKWVVAIGRWAKDNEVFETVQADLAKVGIRVTLQKGEFAEISKINREDPDTNPGIGYSPVRTSQYTQYHLWRMYHSSNKESGAQRSGYGNKEVDALLTKTQAEFDPKARTEMFKKIEEMIWNDAPFVFLFQKKDVVGIRKTITGAEWIPSEEMRVNAVVKK